MNIVLPTVEDIPGIVRLVDIYSRTGVVLKRTPDEIIKSINNFRVVKEENRVIGCVSLFIYSGDLTELRTLIVDPEYQGKRIGTVLVETVKEWTEKLNIKKLFTLTTEVEFFEKRGFVLVSKDILPEKIFKDCQHCRFRDDCRETAMMYTPQP